MSPVDEGPWPRTFTISGQDRLDKELCSLLHISRESAKRMILSGRVRIGGTTRHHPARRVGSKTDIEILPPAVEGIRPPPLAPDTPGPAAPAVEIEILFEDESLLAISKPAGLPVHPGAGHERDTLVDLLKAKKIKLAGMSDPSRAGLVHRLDKDTSGLLLIAKTASAAEHLMLQFAERKIHKEYRAVIRGRMPRRTLQIVGSIGRSPDHRKKFSIQPGGRDAVTAIESLVEAPMASLIRVVPKTGRTHQIRVHLRHAGFPIVGDTVYGARVQGVQRMLLHSYKMIFTHPTKGAKLQVIAPLPKDFVVELIRLGFPGFN